MLRNNKNARGNAAQFFVAGELCRRNLVAMVTLGNAPNTDILCSNLEGTKFVHIQVKTFVPGNEKVAVGKKAEINYGENFFWVLSGIPQKDSESKFEYFIIPSNLVSEKVCEGHKAWASQLGRNGKIRNQDSSFRVLHIPPLKQTLISKGVWDISAFKNRWDLIEKKLSNVD